MTENLREDPYNLKLQARLLRESQDVLFWHPVLKWQLSASLRASISNETREDDLDECCAGVKDFVPGINSRLLDPKLRDEQRTIFEDNAMLIYVEDFFDPETFARINEEAVRLWKSDELQVNCVLDGINRIGGFVLDSKASNENSFYNLISSNLDLMSWVSAIFQMPMFPADFPVDQREYGVHSTGMPCHADVSLYADKTKDAEILVTLFNNSTCITTFIDAFGDEHQIKTKPNSLFLLQGGSAWHCVHCTPSVPGGSREILKFIFTGNYTKDASFWSYVSVPCPHNGENSKAILRRRSGINR